jgi:hypothetical protein
MKKRYLYSIDIIGTDNGAYFEFMMGNFKSRPSFEWIKSIGITECVE